jgi:hypothetical protein
MPPSASLMRIVVERGTSWAASAPAVVVKDGYVTLHPVDLGVTYDISADGERFLMVKAGSAAPLAAPAGIVVVQHWDEELRRVVPTKELPLSDALEDLVIEAKRSGRRCDWPASSESA